MIHVPWDVRITHASGTVDYFHFPNELEANEFRISLSLGPRTVVTSGPCGTLTDAPADDSSWRTEWHQSAVCSVCRQPDPDGLHRHESE